MKRNQMPEPSQNFTPEKRLPENVSETLLSIDKRHLWHPYASATTPPPVHLATSARGVNVTLADGSSLLDAVSSWWCVCHGHNHPVIMDAIRTQTEKLAQVMFAGFTHEPAILLAEALVKKTPPGLQKIFLSDSGSVSVECAAKMAIQYQLAHGKTGRTRLAAFRGGYHGDTTGAMALSDPSGMHTMFRGILPQHCFLPRPDIPFDGDWRDDAFDETRRILEQHASELAAVIIEPIFQGANAMRFYHPGYLKALRAACSELGILLICDEVATGFGRLGRFFASEFSDVIPDILCVGKGITGGAITLAATLASEHVATVISAAPPHRFLHGPTFMANPLACAAACASLELFDSYDWQANVHRIESELRCGLEPLRGCPNIRDVRVLGAVGVLELDRAIPPPLMQQIVRKTGVWFRPLGQWLYAMPPFIATPEDINKITKSMKYAVEYAFAD